uniref:Ras-related protein Rab-17 n=1 Tax=Equus asinus TaxID=9793 RepID=A0A9L0KHP0_EQUAS
MRPVTKLRNPAGAVGQQPLDRRVLPAGCPGAPGAPLHSPSCPAPGDHVTTMHHAPCPETCLSVEGSKVFPGQKEGERRQGAALRDPECPAVRIPGSEQAWGTRAFFTKVVDLGAASLKLEIWDTAGQEKYHSVCHLYFRGANAVLLVYDITRKDSFDMAQQWLKDLEKEFHPGEIVVMLVGNKTDLGEEREVTIEEGKEFAESKRLLFMETSARLNHQVTEVFSAVARELLQREERKEGQTQRRDARLALNERPAGQAKCCAR